MLTIGTNSERDKTSFRNDSFLNTNICQPLFILDNVQHWHDPVIRIMPALGRVLANGSIKLVVDCVR